MEELFDCLSETKFCNCLMTCDGWFNNECLLLFFFCTICRFNVTSKKTTSLRFAWMSILKPMSLKSFFSFCLFGGHWRINPSSWCNSKICFRKYIFQVWLNIKSCKFTYLVTIKTAHSNIKLAFYLFLFPSSIMTKH